MAGQQRLHLAGGWGPLKQPIAADASGRKRTHLAQPLPYARHPMQQVLSSATRHCRELYSLIQRAAQVHRSLQQLDDLRHLP